MIRSGMRVLLTSHGSTGDIYPFIRLGRALVAAGHEVRFATVSLFREEIEAAGVVYVYLPPDWDQSGFAEAMRDLTKARNAVELLGIIYSESLPYLDEILETLKREMGTTDLFVCSYLFSHMSALARERGIPCATATFAHHAVPSPRYPPETIPRLLFLPPSWQRSWNRLCWRLSDRVICWQLNRVVGEHLERHGMGRARSFLIDPADRALVMVSPGLFQPKAIWNDRFVFTGYLRWQSPEDPALEEELRGFCGDERVPILTFGSVTFDGARKVMARFMKNWPRVRKIIIQSGWAGLTIERPRPEMMRIGRVSHDQLFKFGSVVVHHGGAGTTASVLHAGIPQIVVPHIGDQWFFASEVERLGVGRGLKRRRWPELLPGAVQAVARSAKMAARASETAALLARENGPEQAVAVLEDLARDP